MRGKITCGLAFLTFVLIGCSGGGSRTLVDLDSEFGTGGVAVTPFESGDDTGRALAIQDDGKIVVAGCSVLGENCKFGLARYLEDGSLDPSFDSDGRVTTTVGPGEDGAYALALQTDGKIVAAGATFNGVNRDIAVLRYQSDGSLDTSFGGGDGIVISALGRGDDSANAVAIQSDGKIVAAGCSFVGEFCKFVIVRYHPDGSLDDSFGEGGVAITSIGNGEDGAYGMSLQADGKIVAAGATFNGSNRDIALVRYKSDGTLDTTFGGDGIVTTAVEEGDDTANAVAIQSDGKIVVAGCAVLGENCKVVTARYLSTGELDDSFSGGIVTTSVGVGEDGAYGLAIQPDGNIVIAGATFNGIDQDFLLIRYSPEGQPDADFGDLGIIQHPVAAGDDFANGVMLDSEGRIVAAGTAYNGSNQDFCVLRYH